VKRESMTRGIKKSDAFCALRVWGKENTTTDLRERRKNASPTQISLRKRLRRKRKDGLA